MAERKAGRHAAISRISLGQRRKMMSFPASVRTRQVILVISQLAPCGWGVVGKNKHSSVLGLNFSECTCNVSIII